MSEIIFKEMDKLIKFINKNSKNDIQNKILKIENKVDKIIINFEFNVVDLLNRLNFNDFSIDCNNIIFNENVIFNKYIFKNDIIMTNSEFKRNLNINNIKCQGKLDFSNSIFHDNIELKKSTFDYSIIFLGSKFISENSKSFSIEDIKVVDKLDFTSSLFNMEISFIGLTNNKLVFNNSIHNKKIELYGCHIKKVIFYETKFIDDVIISSPKFNKIILSNIILLNNIFFKNIVFIDTIYFNKVNFTKEQSFISISSLKLNKIKKVIFKNTYLYGKTNFENLKIKNLNLEGTNIMGNFSIINCDINNLLNWQTARILKHEEYKKSNIIKALEYHAEETKLYKKKLINESNKTLKDWGDIFSIYISSLYSNNGLNWIKSFLCTILFSTFFFIASYINCNISIVMYALFIFYIINRLKLKDIAKYISNTILLYLFTFWLLPTLYLYLDIKFLKELFKFFVPTNFDYIENASFIYSNKISIVEATFICLSYFLGKIAFWYGSVQTVQAFRKFSKKE